MPGGNFLLQKEFTEKTTKEQKGVEGKLKKLVKEQQNILCSNEIKCEEYHTAIDPFKVEISQKLNLLIDRVSKIERFLRGINSILAKDWDYFDLKVDKTSIIKLNKPDIE